MRWKNRSRAAFTLLELLVVLTILAIVTGMAVRTLDQVEDQKRFEAAQLRQQELLEAVIGSPDDRHPDGTVAINGFLSDMGRLPHTVLVSDPAFGERLELRELWSHSPTFDVRQANGGNGVAPDHQDPDVYVPGGWRGPYLRLPLGGSTLLDGWGNPLASPDSTGFARLRDASDQAITAAAQPVSIVRILGRNGTVDSSSVSAYDRDDSVSFGDSLAAVSCSVEVKQGDTPILQDGSSSVTVRIFSPNPTNPTQVAVSAVTRPYLGPTVVVPFITVDRVPAGTRIVRAYLHTTGTSAAASAMKRSPVRQAALRGGPNSLHLTIDR